MQSHAEFVVSFGFVEGRTRTTPGMKLSQRISLIAAGCCTVVWASQLAPAFVASRSSRGLHQGTVGQTSSSSSSLLLATSEGDEDDDDISNSITSSKKRGTKFASPEINAYTKQQTSRIFGSSTKSEFVPLDFAGIWSQKLFAAPDDISPSDTKKNSLGNIEAILLSSTDQCQDIANSYEKYLSSKQDTFDDEDASSIKALPIPIAPSASAPAIKLLSQTYACTPLSKSVLLSFNTLFLSEYILSILSITCESYGMIHYAHNN